MKIMSKRNFYAIIALCLFPLLETACSSDDHFENQFVKESSVGVVASVPDFCDAEGIFTRTTLTPTSTGIAFSWKDGDQIGVYSESNAMLCYSFMEVEGTDAKTARFNGGGFDLKADQKYYTIYPYAAEKTSCSQVPVVFSGQRQLTNNSTDHLGSFDFMAASAIATGPNEAIFNYSHLGAVARIKIAVPIADRYTSLSLSSSSPLFVTEGTVDLTSSAVSILSTKTDSKITLLLGEEGYGLEVFNSNLYITAYLSLAPVDLSKFDLTLTVTSASGNEYHAVVGGKKFEAGKAYGFVADHTYVDLGLSTKWATCNVGAESSFDVGNYYAWGEVFPKTEGYFSTWSDYKWCEGGEDYSCHTITKYCVGSEYGKDGFTDGVSILELADDAANKNWDGKWRMPTSEELAELENSCFWCRTTNYKESEKGGFIVYKAKNESHKGKKSLDNPEFSSYYSLSDPHIFLPVTGQIINSRIFNSGWAAYWSSSLCAEYSYDAWWFNFVLSKDKSETFSYQKGYRYIGQAIRPVL